VASTEFFHGENGIIGAALDETNGTTSTGSECLHRLAVFLCEAMIVIVGDNVGGFDALCT